MMAIVAHTLATPVFGRTGQRIFRPVLRRCSSASAPGVASAALASAALSPDARGNPCLRPWLHVPWVHRGNAMNHRSIRDLTQDHWNWELPSDIGVVVAVRGG
jgi:hypothetical protein